MISSNHKHIFFCMKETSGSSLRLPTPNQNTMGLHILDLLEFLHWRHQACNFNSQIIQSSSSSALSPSQNRLVIPFCSTSTKMSRISGKQQYMYPLYLEFWTLLFNFQLFLDGSGQFPYFVIHDQSSMQ